MMKAKLYTMLCITYVMVIDCTEQLRYVAILYRHGDRTPVNMYPTDPWRNESLWPVRFGQLTNKGKQQHFALGQWLRARYNHIISKKFDPTEIYVRSTDVDRTLMSAMANLAGMYPPVADSVWNPQLQWQPIPVHTKPEKEDELLSMKKKCHNFDIAMKQLVNSKEYKERLQKYDKLLNYLSMYAGYEVKDYLDILDIYSDLKIEKLYNFTLPNWTAEVFPDKLVEPAGYSFTLDTATPLMTRLKVGPFLKELINNMFKVKQYYNSMLSCHNEDCVDLDKVRPLKMHIYSAHDLNIGSVLNGLGLYDGKCPEYTATILFELSYDEANLAHYVRILYRNSVKIIEPKPLYIPNCGYRCPLDNFTKIYNHLLPVNWDEECRNEFSLSLGVMCVFCILLFFCYCFPLCVNFGMQCWGSMQYSRLRSNSVTEHEKITRLTPKILK